MRWYHRTTGITYTVYGKRFECDHPVYNRCTLYRDGLKGLAVIQQRFNPVSKVLWWDEIDPNLVDEIYMHPKFKTYFEKYASESVNGLYPTVTVRQIMWGLRMKPLKRHVWESVYDRAPIER